MEIVWDPDKEDPTIIEAKYNTFLSVKKDVTSLVNSRVKVIASRPLTQEEKEYYNNFGPKNYEFNSGEKYDSLKAFAEGISEDFPRGPWEVSNIMNLDYYSMRQTNKPNDVGYTVGFMHCPWDIFLRYWRKPIRLTSKLSYRRYYKKDKMPNKTANKNIDILSFSQTLNDWNAGQKPAFGLLNNQVILADFRYAFSEKKRNSIDQDITEWMLENVSSFKLLTDESTPFCDPITEFCFTSDIFGKYRER